MSQLNPRLTCLYRLLLRATSDYVLYNSRAARALYIIIFIRIRTLNSRTNRYPAPEDVQDDTGRKVFLNLSHFVNLLSDTDPIRGFVHSRIYQHTI